MSLIGTKRYVCIGANIFPGIVTSEPTAETVTYNGRQITVQRADILSLRTTNPANGPVTSYLTVSNENLRFSPARADKVEGIDVDAKGKPIPLATLLRLHAESTANWLATRSQGTTVVLKPATMTDDTALADLPI